MKGGGGILSESTVNIHRDTEIFHGKEECRKQGIYPVYKILKDFQM